MNSFFMDLRALFIVVFFSALPFFVSCHRRPLDVGTNAVRIALENDYSMPYRESRKIPYNYSILMYSHEGELQYEDFCPEKGGLIRGETGQYRAFVYDLDNDVTKFDGRDNLETLRAYTVEESVSRS